jgi:hypothetical protein
VTSPLASQRLFERLDDCRDSEKAHHASRGSQDAKDGTEGEKVGASIQVLATRLFRRHKGDGANDQSKAGERRS